MADQAIQNAKRRRDEIAKEINNLNERMSTLKRDLAHVDGFISAWNDFAGIEESHGVLPTAAAPSVSHPPNPPRERVGDEVARLLHVANHPLLRDDLYDALSAAGVKIYGKDPKMVLSTMMWRMQDRFIRLSGGRGYWFRDRPCPAVGYVPGRGNVLLTRKIPPPPPYPAIPGEEPASE